MWIYFLVMSFFMTILLFLLAYLENDIKYADRCFGSGVFFTLVFLTSVLQGFLGTKKIVYEDSPYKPQIVIDKDKERIGIIVEDNIYFYTDAKTYNNIQNYNVVVKTKKTICHWGVTTICVNDISFVPKENSEK